MADFSIAPKGAKPPREIDELAAAIEADGGAALAAYQEPLGDHWHLFALLPIAMVKPTPYQRDLSPAHLKRMVEVMKKLDRFTEPIVAVRSGGIYCTPERESSPRRRRKIKGARLIRGDRDSRARSGLSDSRAQHREAHNLRDKALEVVRMYRARLGTGPAPRGERLRLRVRARAFHHARNHVREETALLRRSVRAAIEPRGWIPRQAARIRIRRSPRTRRPGRARRRAAGRSRGTWEKSAA